jgi:dTMP kinase
MRDLLEGLRFMRQNKLTRSILGVMIIGFIGGGSLYILGAPFAEQVMNATGAKFTLILTILLSGVVVGAAFAPAMTRRFPVEKWFGRAVVGFGLVMIIFALIDLYPLSLVVIGLGGILLGYMIVTAYTLLHHNLDEEIRGRVFAAMQTIMRTCLLISMGVFALVGRLFRFWIPLSPENPLPKSLDLGFMTKSIYPAMLALIVGGFIVVAGGLYSMRSLGNYFKSTKEGSVEAADTAT